ncbi:MAG TPA: Maf family protein [Bacillota bacterium]|nr:Maf family protein [Bacillota bacterium]
MAKKLILASSSPRRQELLNQVGIPFTLRKQDVDESKITTTNPLEKVKQLASLKGLSTPLKDDKEVILSADTVVAYQERIFEKPQSKEEAYQMIAALSGATHDVLTGVMLRSQDDAYVFAERTKVEFWPLTPEEIEWYVSTDDPYDKAGAYGIQSLGTVLVKRLIGDYANVVGLPIARVVRELKNFSVYPKSI